MFRCQCGANLMLPAQKCAQCGARVVFDFGEQKIRPLRKDEQDKLCANSGIQCNWLVDDPAIAARVEGGGALCRACSLSRIVPAIRGKRALESRRTFERAKKRLIIALMRMGLFPKYAAFNGMRLEINLLEDKMANPDINEDWVPTGHAAGVITINAREADRAALEAARQTFGEKYRTLLGHVRHESGHYFWHVLVQCDENRLSSFRALFGDEREDYAEALRRHYARPPRQRNRPNEDFITPYSASHPHEDWAESWAHFMHLEDALSVARDLGLVGAPPMSMSDGFETLLKQWLDTAGIINEMNASLGFRPPYPFKPSGKAAQKMRFVCELVQVAGV